MTHRTATWVALILVSALATSCGGTTASRTTDTPPLPPTGEPAVTNATTTDTTAVPVDTTTDAPSDETPSDWAEFEEAFMAGCGANASAEECACMFDEFQERYEFEDFFSWAYQAQDDPRIVEVAELCST